MTLDDSLDTTISCVDGDLWVTQDGDPRDVILRAGQKFLIDRASRVVVFATSDATFEVTSGHAQQRPEARLAGLGLLTRLFAASAPSAVSAAF